jgi:von Willebrand factor type A domain
LASDGEKGHHFFEKPAFKGTAAVVALATAVLALLGPLRSIIDDLFPSTEPVSWVEVVLDTSTAMGKEFDGETRLQAAAEAIEKAVKELDNSGLGLRRTAISCKGESEQLVGLDSGNTDKVVDEARDQQPQGSSSIVDAVIGGLEEFQREPIASRGPESRRLLVFTAGVSECSNGNVGEEIADALRGANISQSSKVELIALGASSEEKDELEEFEAALDEYANVNLYTPQDESELNDVAEDAGEQASAVAEHLEGEREAGFYEQP